MLDLRLTSPWYRSARNRSPRTALVALFVAGLPACSPGKAADSAGMAGSSSNSTSTTSLTDSSSETAPSTGIVSASAGSATGTGTDTSPGATTTSSSSSGSTSGPAWPPAECGDVVCGEGRICVVDWYWDCCTFQVASTGTTTDGTTTDGGTTASTGTTTGTGTSTGDSTTWDSTTGCRADTVTTYECKPLPPGCSLDDRWLLQCLSDAFCYLGFLADSFADGYLYCPGPAHGCY